MKHINNNNVGSGGRQWEMTTIMTRMLADMTMAMVRVVLVHEYVMTTVICGDEGCEYDDDDDENGNGVDTDDDADVACNVFNCGMTRMLADMTMAMVRVVLVHECVMTTVICGDEGCEYDDDNGNDDDTDDGDADVAWDAFDFVVLVRTSANEDGRTVKGSHDHDTKPRRNYTLTANEPKHRISSDTHGAGDKRPQKGHLSHPLCFGIRWLWDPIDL